ncbi:ATP-binding protein [Comamonas sp. JUb58]|uniref:ATP-binding protein n=1 Tax=Comamonas sp. JUb58 TaxID=2485114 RepID=UPI00105B5176|nr:ATP-binding protein [Comamonas sp. JUb58]TDS84985.1 two-component system sensor kinase/two-component system sensor histidine kinase AdeS [Comamonas sp. JUb58]
MKLDGLSKKIMVWMMGMSVAVITISVMFVYAFYYIWDAYWPESYKINESSGAFPSFWEWIFLTFLTLGCLVLAAIVAVRLANRILIPLNSVTLAIKQVAQGNLNARAEVGHSSLGEAAILANDFNMLAEKLERVTQEQKFWNAAIAHELRTPITILSGRLQGLSDGIFMPSQDNFQKLLKSVESLGRLVEDLRTVGLADAGHLYLHFEQARLDEDVLSVVHFFEERFVASHHQCVLALELQEAWCDPMRIKQALLALFENAHKHAVGGTITVRTRINDAGEYLLAVDDEGPGVPEHLAPHVFQAFRRSARTDNVGSTGLGLAVVAAIAQAHNGRAAYERLPNGGSRFSISWKRA